MPKTLPDFGDRDTNKLYRTMRENGVSHENTLKTIKMMTGKEPIPEVKEPTWYSYKYSKKAKPNFPYYYGKQKRF